MGANQSKTPLPNEKLIVERLRALELKDQADSEFVLVDEKNGRVGAENFKAPWISLSVGDVKHWETELLRDSKNRFVLSPR